MSLPEAVRNIRSVVGKMRKQDIVAEEGGGYKK